MLFEHGQSLQQGYEPPSKKACSGPGPSGSRDPSPGAGPLDCSKSENNVADLRIRQVGQSYINISDNNCSVREILNVSD